ncbi:MAG: PASTA domain-containing protein [Bacteroidetes bacterium]|nr:MAG: PASTA domain-containing protein [Bacteroidota bacterium]
MKDIILFLKSKRFRVHFIISVLVGGFILWISFKFLNVYTHHGEAIVVPDFANVKITEIDGFIADKNLKYQIIDSVFDSKVSPGVVIKQDPEENSSVKQNRTIYLTVSAKLPPLVKMPNVVDASMRQALAMLESYGLKVGKRNYMSDPCVNCVLAQSMKGKKIEPGTMIPKGSVIDLTLGQGQDGEKINIPCLLGLSHQEATDKIAESGFSEGSVNCVDCKTNADKEKAKVFKQNPTCSSDIMLNPGSSIDLYTSIKAKLMTADTSSIYDEK